MKHKLMVDSIFKTIQGESSYQGRPCVLIRLSGCNLSCRYCDTPYTRSGGEEVSIEDIVQQSLDFYCPLVEVTGGEPLIQEHINVLFSRLLSFSLTVLLETNGSIAVDQVPDRVVKILDMKCPSSGMDSHMRFENLEHLNPLDEVKFVISDQQDYRWTRDILKKYRIDERCSVLFSPVTGTLSPETLAQWMLDDNLNVRLNLQLHKIIWGPDTRR